MQSALPARCLLSSLAVILAAGCANKPLASVDRTKYGRIGFAPEVEMPKRYSYADATMNGTGAVAANFGLVGALVGGAIVAAEEGAGRRKVDAVIAGAKVDPAAVLAGHFRRQVEGLDLFDVRSANPAAQFRLKVLGWGFGSGGSGKLAAALSARVELVATNGQTKVWSRTAFGTSPTTATAEEFQADPKLFNKAFEEVADLVARKLTGEWE